jgi:iron complex outermembrane receptor protein
MNVEVTSVAKEPQSYSEAPASIDVITSEDIDRSGASSIPEALQTADNLEVAQKDSHDWAISARGFNTDLSNKLLVLMDGRILYTPLFSGVFWDVQDYLLADIDQIEVISGPGGSLWGANAVNGVINITTKGAQDTQGGYVEAGVGTQLEDFFGLRYGAALAHKVYVRVYAKDFDRASDVLTDGQSADDAWHMRQAGFRLDDLAVTDTTLTFQGDAYKGSEGVTTGGTAQTSGENLIGRWSRTFSPDSDLSLQVYFDRTYLADPIPASEFAGAGILTDTLDSYNVDLQDRFRWGARNRFVWGGTYEVTSDSVVNAPGLAFYPTHLDQSLYSGFIQDEIELLPKVVLTLGSKYEHNPYTGGEWEPTARLAWTPASHQLLWAAVSRAVRTPSRVDENEDEPNPPPGVLVGESRFGDETLAAYEAGYRAEVTSQLSGTVSLFYNDYNDVRSLSYTPATILPLYFSNNLYGDTYGAEAAATYQVLSWWRLHASYDLLRENIRVKPGQVDLNNALNETADPVHQSALSSSWDLPHRISLDARLRWVDPLKINNGGVPAWVPGYSELNARIAWQATRRLELSVVGQNLLHRLHIEYGVPGPTNPEIERGVYGKAALRF